jgi:hypothetical protein
VRQPVESALLEVSLTRGEHEREVARFAGLDEALLEGHEQLVGRAASGIARRGNRVSAMDDRDGVGRLDDLLEPHAHLPSG